ncbi:MAG: response regulator [Citromicrobium sp.]|nr:MAG: response regulator [Citromicrobium sp.]
MIQANETNKAGRMPHHVLVVEDDAVIGMMIEQALSDAGVKIIELCPTTELALVALRKQTPNAVVLDVHLADRDDGWAIAELIESIGPDHPQIIFSTGMPNDIPTHIAELGAVLEKPYEPALLINLLREPKRRGLISRLKNVLKSD